jgi:hypothetical protein
MTELKFTFLRFNVLHTVAYSLSNLISERAACFFVYINVYFRRKVRKNCDGWDEENANVVVCNLANMTLAVGSCWTGLKIPLGWTALRATSK